MYIYDTKRWWIMALEAQLIEMNWKVLIQPRMSNAYTLIDYDTHFRKHLLILVIHFPRTAAAGLL